jgi:methionyl-tRNA formyltransferase
LRLGFAASAPFGADVLERLARNHEIAFVLTQPDAAAGRGRGLRPAPAKLKAMQLGLPVVESLDEPLSG